MLGLCPRKQLALTQAGLAVELGCTKTAVAYWERGERPMPPWMHLALAGLAVKAAFTPTP